MPSIDPITGLPNGDDSSQETHPSFPLRPQSPLVRGTHLDKSVDRTKKRPTLSQPADDANMLQPAKRGELQGYIPPGHMVTHPRERLNHIIDVVECVMEGIDEFVSDLDLLSSYPINLEKTRFTMSKKKLKLQFMDDVLDRMEDERWMHQENFERRRKLWHKSVGRSLKFINKFIDREQRKIDQDPPPATPAKDATREKKRGRPFKAKDASTPVAATPAKPPPAKKEPKRGGGAVRKEKEKKESALKEAKAPKEAASKKPTFGRKKKEVPREKPAEEKKRKSKQTGENEESVAVPPKKTRKEKEKEAEGGEKEAERTPTKPAVATKAKKPAFGAPKRGKKAAKEDEVEKEAPAAPATAAAVVDAAAASEAVAAVVVPSPSEGEETEVLPAAASTVSLAAFTPVEEEKKNVFLISHEPQADAIVADETMDMSEGAESAKNGMMMEERRTERSQESRAASQIKMELEGEKRRRLEEYDKIGEEEEERPVVRSQRRDSQHCSQSRAVSQSPASQSIIVLASGDDDGMETDDEDWEPNDHGRERTPPPMRGLLSSSQDPLLPPSTPSVMSSQSLFSGSLNSSLLGSPNSSFSSQSSSSLLAPLMPSFNFSSSLMPSQPLASSTQKPESPPPPLKTVKKEESKEQPVASQGGPKVRPTFGKRK